MQLPKYVLISGIHVDEQDPFSGIFNTQKQVFTTDETKLVREITRNYAKNSFVISLTDYPDINFETLPFTGTVDCEFTLYIES